MDDVWSYDDRPKPSGSRGLENPPPYSWEKAKEARDSGRTGAAASETTDLSQEIRLQPPSMQSYSQPWTNRQTSPPATVPSVHIHVQPAARSTPTSKRKLLTVRNCAFAVIIAKSIWLAVDIIKMSRTIHIGKSIRRDLKNDDSFHEDDLAQTIHHVLEQLHVALVILLTIKCITLGTFILAFYATLKEKRWFLLIAIKINILLDTVVLTIVFITDSEPSIAFIKVMECCMEIGTLVLLLLYYIQLRKRDVITRSSEEDSTRTQLLSLQHSERSPEIHNV